MKWGILGTGMIAKKFATDLPHSKTGELAAVGSRTMASSQRFTGEFGGTPYGGYEALLADSSVEAVYISLPNILHREWSIRALEAGKHVLCEKPLALNAAEAEEMFAAAKSADQTLIEAFMYRARPQTTQLFQSIKEGVIGELRLIRANFTFAREASIDDARYRPDEGGGSIMDVGCYCTDFIRTLAGEEPTHHQATIHRHELGGVDDYAAGTLSFSNGVLATFTSGMTVVSDQTAHIAGTTGRIEIHQFWRGEGGYRIIRPGDSPENPIVEEVAAPESPLPIYAEEADAFAEVALGERPNWNPPENTVANMKVLDALRRDASCV